MYVHEQYRECGNLQTVILEVKVVMNEICEEKSGCEKNVTLPTDNSTSIIKYTCAVCRCHEEIHAQKWDMLYIPTYTYNIITHVCSVEDYKYRGNPYNKGTTVTCDTYIFTHVCGVQYTALDFTSCGHTGTCTCTCSNKYGVLRRYTQVASSLGSPPHECTLILDLCTRTK